MKLSAQSYSIKIFRLPIRTVSPAWDTFDNKLSRRLRVERLSERVTNRLSVLKRLAGCKWGCARSTINTTFNTFILPLMTYCCEAIITAPQLVINKNSKYCKTKLSA
ncbi:hypothetical protein AVEN_218719-1 [Araneus ventricosus]|uniref:Uncharacterized protein n=1 Tax=Araneus ventricosus TaxID=182803 RepID=A0A4Y2B4T6_ARAVE|nr:hypothetical protein AVEN_218719-1 [Araneus ventricosus]